MKNITLISSRLPYPPDKDGFTENIFHLIKELKTTHDISIRLIIFKNDDKEYYPQELHKYLDAIIYEHKRKGIYKYFLKKIEHGKYVDSSPVLFCDLFSSYYSNMFRAPRKILYAADSRSFYFKKQRGIYALLKYTFFVMIETILYPKFNKIIFVSNLDNEYSRRRTRNNGIQIPIGYNIDRIEINSKKEYDLIFSGNFNYLPNGEAAELFIKTNFEKILSLRPNIKICFVGRFPTSLMKRYSKIYPKNIIVTGEVKSVEEYLGKAKIYFSPLISGSGMKNKILQAMASKLPIVCTEESISGFSHLNNASVIIVKAQTDMIFPLLRYLKMEDIELSKIGQYNQDYFLKYYSWKNVVNRYYLDLLCISQ